MNKLILIIFIAFSTFYTSSLADDKKPEISQKEKNALIDIFSGKVEQGKDLKETEKNDEVQESFKRKFKEIARLRDAENEKRMANMSEKERKKFKEQIAKQRAEAKAKMKKMTPEQKAAFFKKASKRGKK